LSSFALDALWSTTASPMKKHDTPTDTLTPQRKHRKLLKDGSDVEVWPESSEKTFVQGEHSLDSLFFIHRLTILQVSKSTGSRPMQLTLSPGVEVDGETSFSSTTCSAMAFSAPKSRLRAIYRSCGICGRVSQVSPPTCCAIRS